MPTPKIMAGIGRFQEYVLQNPELFDEPAEGVHPQALFVTCSDARIVPHLLTGASVGELFVQRSIANVVPPFGTGAMGAGATLEYAVLMLGISHIILCGHTDCGGIKALDHPPDWSRMPHIARWVELARPAKTKVEASGLPSEAHHLAVVRENVLLQLENLRTYDPVRQGEQAGTLTLHGWVYHVETATVEAYDLKTGQFAPLQPAES